jgi:hypothetical protein
LKEQFHGEGKNKVINFTSYIHNHKSVPKKLKNTAGNVSVHQSRVRAVHPLQENFFREFCNNFALISRLFYF